MCSKRPDFARRSFEGRSVSRTYTATRKAWWSLGLNMMTWCLCRGFCGVVFWTGDHDELLVGGFNPSEKY